MATITLIALPAPFLDEPCMNPPLGLSYISAYLKANGYADIKAVDLAYNYDRFYLGNIPIKSDFYFISCLSPQFKYLVEVTKHIKQTNPQATIVIGGPHATCCPEDCLMIASGDIVVRGDGEKPSLMIIEGQDLDSIPGVCYLYDDNRIVEKSPYREHDLDSLPVPDRDIFDLSKYNRTLEGNKAVHLVTLRGCPFSCAFCDKVTVGHNVRYRSIDNVMSEIDNIIRDHGIRSFVIYDDLFTLSNTRLYDFCRGFKSRQIRWRCWSRTDTVNKNKLIMMQESGLTSITFGVESGDNSVLRNINKKTTVLQNYNALMACKSVGIPVRCSLMYGNPGETKESIDNTISLIELTQPDEWNLSILTPIPGSAIWNDPDKFGVHFDKDAIQARLYEQLNRFGESGIGNINVSLDTMNDQEFRDNLQYFVSELERVCPRDKVQDTIQRINLEPETI